jgi:High potential iron-sulfur protein
MKDPDGIDGRMPRRAVLHRAVATLGVFGALAACKKKPLVCEGLPGLTADELQLRKTLQYADASPQPGKTCTNCTLFVAAKEPDTCGACKVLHGPVHPNGWCKIFVLKPEGGAPT